MSRDWARRKLRQMRELEEKSEAAARHGWIMTSLERLREAEAVLGELETHGWRPSPAESAEVVRHWPPVDKKEKKVLA